MKVETQIDQIEEGLLAMRLATIYTNDTVWVTDPTAPSSLRDEAELSFSMDYKYNKYYCS